jgi:bifunctional non-homologous end joining protein LigD
MNPLLAKLAPQYKKLLKKQRMPTFEKPMLATLTKHYFSHKDWIYEHKLDGVRCLVLKNKKKTCLKSRNDLSLSSTYPEIAMAAESLPVDQVILDGEVVSLAKGSSSFEKLQTRMGVKNPSPELIKKTKIYIYVFDILYLDGYDVTHLPLLERKNILKAIVTTRWPIRYLPHRPGKGLLYFHQACKKGWEGVIAKNKTSTYVHVRSTNWLKFKCVQEQELIICGYTDPQGSRAGFGALLVGYYKDKKLYYAGKVGTGYNDAFLRSFSKKLHAIEIKKNIFANAAMVEVQHAHFVKPYYVGQFGFEEWTRDNKLRQGRFLGLRNDKNARDVVREVPKNYGPG